MVLVKSKFNHGSFCIIPHSITSITLFRLLCFSWRSEIKAGNYLENTWNAVSLIPNLWETLSLSVTESVSESVRFGIHFCCQASRTGDYISCWPLGLALFLIFSESKPFSTRAYLYGHAGPGVYSPRVHNSQGMQEEWHSLEFMQFGSSVFSQPQKPQTPPL